MSANKRRRWAGIIVASAGVASVVVASCGGESAREPGDAASRGAGGSRAGSRSGMSGTSGSAGRVTSAGQSGAGGTTGTRAGAPGRGGSHEGLGGSQEGDAGSRASGAGGRVEDNGATSGGGLGGTPSRPRSVHACGHPSAWSANLELCDHGFVHRTSDAMCPLPPHPEEGGAGGVSSVGIRVRCLSDSECATDEYCVLEFTDPVDSPPEGFHREIETLCHSSCVSNDDCASGEVCSCDPTFVSAVTGEALTLGVCAPAGCHTDTDCPTGTLCVASLGRDQLESSCETEVQLVDQFQCQSERDECSGPADCDWVSEAGEGGRGPLGRLNCAYGGGHRSCYQFGVHPECES